MIKHRIMALYISQIYERITIKFESIAIYSMDTMRYDAIHAVWVVRLLLYSQQSMKAPDCCVCNV